jgi:FtsP/CotA-like multicopper oxidase with cupredoxin domain
MMRVREARLSRWLKIGAPIAALAALPVSEGAAQDLKAVVPEPWAITSVNGVLNATLTAQPGVIQVAGKTFVSNVYNRSYVPPVLRVRRGDQVRLRLINRIGDDAHLSADGGDPQPTNLHYHGMAIPPRLPGDFIYMLVAPGTTSGAPAHAHHGDAAAAPGAMVHAEHGMLKTVANEYNYRWTVPADHAQGVYWYHPHPHGISEDQVLGGLSGMLVVDGLIDEHYPELVGLKRRTFMLKDIQLPGDPDSAPKTKTINGALGGTISSRPGQFEIWELGNIGADSYFDIAIDGHEFWVLERDGTPVVRPQLVSRVYLPPSSRAMIVVRVGAAGRYSLRTRRVATGSAGDPNPNVVLATLVSAGSPASHPGILERLGRPAASIATLGPTVAEVRSLPVTRTRTIVYTENAAGTRFFLNGRAFDMSRIDVQVKLGDVEEWTLVNNTDERHTFHIHQLDFLVQELTGTNTLEVRNTLRDNIDIPYRDPVTREPGRVKVKIPFTNPLIVGMFPFHCHILEHEGGGMMANLLVVR